MDAITLCGVLREWKHDGPRKKGWSLASLELMALVHRHPNQTLRGYHDHLKANGFTLEIDSTRWNMDTLVMADYVIKHKDPTGVRFEPSNYGSTFMRDINNV